jgi:hypothetical protein
VQSFCGCIAVLEIFQFLDLFGLFRPEDLVNISSGTRPTARNIPITSSDYEFVRPGY